MAVVAMLLMQKLAMKGRPVDLGKPCLGGQGLALVGLVCHGQAKSSGPLEGAFSAQLNLGGS